MKYIFLILLCIVSSSAMAAAGGVSQGILDGMAAQRQQAIQDQQLEYQRQQIEYQRLQLEQMRQQPQPQPQQTAPPSQSGNMSCGFTPLQPIGCSVGPCECDQMGQNCHWTFYCK
jgi:type II secretory pathway pseudopilin PulG